MTFIDKRRLVPLLVLGLVLGEIVALLTGMPALMAAWLGMSLGVVVAYGLDATRGPVPPRRH